jgi:uncharacterized protein (TIGR03067 family)
MAQQTTDAAKKDLQKLQGEWVCEYEKGHKLIYVFKDDTLQMYDEKKNNAGKFAVVLDPSKKPKNIDLYAILAGMKTSKALPSIYELTGDTLKFRIGSKRPTDFKEKPGEEPIEAPRTFKRAK